MKRKVTILLIIFITPLLFGQKEYFTGLTLNKIFDSKLESKSFGPNKWFHDGSGVAILRNSVEGHEKDIVKYNPEGYRDGSPITWAHQLKGKLLIIHGTGDSNVHYQSFEALINELVAHKKQFSMMAYPNRNHDLREGRNTQYHLFELRTRFLLEEMSPNKH